MRELTTVKIEKISLVGAPANKKTWLLKKSEDEDELTVAVGKFLGVEVGVEKAERAEIVAAVEELEIYKENMPTGMLDACGTLARVCAQGVTVEVEKEEEEEEHVDPNDEWPSVKAFALPKEIEEEEEIEKEEEEFDEMDYDPVQVKLKRIEKKLDGLEEKEPEDPWPSLNKYVPDYQAPVVKAKVKKEKEDPDKKGGPIRKQLDSDEADDEAEIKKNVKVDDEDPYPSIPDSLFELP